MHMSCAFGWCDFDFAKYKIGLGMISIQHAKKKQLLFLAHSLEKLVEISRKNSLLMIA